MDDRMWQIIRGQVERGEAIVVNKKEYQGLISQVKKLQDKLNAKKPS